MRTSMLSKSRTNNSDNPQTKNNRNSVKRAQYFINKFELHYLVHIDWMQHGNRFHQWFSELLQGVSRPTAMRYRQWMSSYLTLIDESDMAAIISNIGRIERKRSHIENKKGLLASIIAAEGVFKIVKALVETKQNGVSRYQMGELAAMWIIAGAMTGIRPSEWITVKIINNFRDSNETIYNRVIEVTSAKKGGRALRYSELKRHLTFDHWISNEVDLIMMFINFLPKEKIEFNRLKIQVQHTIVKAANRAVGADKKFTIYSCRHLYASEYRRLPGSTRYKLAAALGHSDIINQLYYSDKHQDQLAARRFTFNLALPTENEANEVLKTASARSERSRNRVLKKFGVTKQKLRPNLLEMEHS